MRGRGAHRGIRRATRTAGRTGGREARTRGVAGFRSRSSADGVAVKSGVESVQAGTRGRLPSIRPTRARWTFSQPCRPDRRRSSDPRRRPHRRWTSPASPACPSSLARHPRPRGRRQGRPPGPPRAKRATRTISSLLCWLVNSIPRALESVTSFQRARRTPHRVTSATSLARSAPPTRRASSRRRAGARDPARPRGASRVVREARAAGKRKKPTPSTCRRGRTTRNHDECRVYVRSLTGIGRRAALMATVGGLSLGSRCEGSPRRRRGPPARPVACPRSTGRDDRPWAPATVPAREGLRRRRLER